MKKLTLILGILFIGILGSFAQPGGSLGEESDIVYSNEIIAAVQQSARLAAEKEVAKYNLFSLKLDITLFSYYSAAYSARKRELASKPVGNQHLTQAEIKAIEEDYAAQEAALCAAIERCKWVKPKS